MTNQYWAGIIDGEGYIGIVRQKSVENLTVIVAVSITDRRIPDLLKEQFGGSVISVKRRESYRTIYAWKIYAKKAEAFLREIYPYLIIKKNQATLALELRDSMKTTDGVMSRGPYYNRDDNKDQRVRVYREDLSQKIRDLNQRGVISI